MDLGVGLFVFCFTLRIIRNADNEEQKINSDLINVAHKTWFTFKRSVIFLVLGISRVVLLKAFGYKIDYSEYGLHWNFFFTIFLIRVIYINNFN